MARQEVNIGVTANDGTGDNLRAGGDKINDNFIELYGALGVDWIFAANGNNFPTAAIKGKLYIAQDDHGNPGDADYVSANSWMIARVAGANSFSQYSIKP